MLKDAFRTIQKCLDVKKNFGSIYVIFSYIVQAAIQLQFCTFDWILEDLMAFFNRNLGFQFLWWAVKMILTQNSNYKKDW